MHSVYVGAVVAVAVALSVGFLLGFLIVKARQRSELDRWAADQQTSVQLYLRRKVAEAGVDIGNPVTGTDCQEVLAANVTMATALLDFERRAVEMGDTQEFGLASTMRLQSTKDGPVPTDPPEPPPKLPTEEK